MQGHHTAIQPNNHTTVLPYYLLPFYNIYYHTTTLPYCHTTILHFCHTILPHYPAALLQYCYTEILPHCHTAILPYCQTSILPLPLLLRLSPTPIHTYIFNTPNRLLVIIPLVLRWHAIWYTLELLGRKYTYRICCHVFDVTHSGVSTDKAVIR